jgi:transcriptional regulator with XRE-family HTH domain
MIPLSDSNANFIAQLQAAFGLSITALGRLLGVGRSMLSQVLSGHRALPPSTGPMLARLLLALDQLPTPLADAPDAEALARHQRACLARAMRLALDLADMQTRAAWAGRRLAALPTLAASLPEGPLPRWLTAFEAEARETLAACGALPQAKLALRRAALLHEAALAERLVAGGEIINLVD